MSTGIAPGAPLPVTFYARPAPDLAVALLGRLLRVGICCGRIVETEAYTRTDPASHSFRGPTARNRSMFGTPGTAYVYRSYGIHWCLNVVGLPGEAVLLRAIAPLQGEALMAARRGTSVLRLLASGPGRLSQAFGINADHDGLALDAAGFALFPGDPPHPDQIAQGPRIGLSRAVDVPWRFGLRNSPFLSRKFAPTSSQMLPAKRDGHTGTL